MTLQKTHKYKVFSPTGQYLGLIPDNRVASDFTYNQSIATAFVQTQITIAQSADVSILPTTPILDELGNPILDENSQQILDEGALDVVGSNNANALYACNNLIQVWEYSNYYPNGLLVFSGYISKWKAIFGGGSEGSIVLTCISNGQDMNNYLVSASSLADQSQTTQNANIGLFDAVLSSKLPETQFYGQTFTVGAGITNLNAIAVMLAGVGTSFNFSISLYSAVNGTLLGTTTVRSISSITPAVYQFIFATSITVTPGQQYFFTVQCQDTSDATVQGSIYYKNSDVYAGGQMYYQAISSPGGGSIVETWTPGDGTIGATDLYFVTYHSAAPNSVQFTNTDPASILATVISNYSSAGGLVSAPAAGYAATSILTSYTFKTQTVLQGIQAILNLSPANYYWYVDPGSNILQYGASATVADFILVKGRHINELDIEATRENIKNNIYFTGGDDGTGTNTNIFVLVQNALGGNRVGLALLSDNRVNSTAGGVTTARLIAQEYANDNNAETYITNVVIQDQQVDTNLFKIGKMVGFANFSPFVNNLLLQIVGIQKASDQVTLQLGTLPARESQQFAQIQAGLAYQQTVANPATPS